MAVTTLYPTQAVRVSYGAKYNNYDNNELRVGVQSDTSTRYMTLVQFDISAIPAHSTITSADFSLWSYSDACWRYSVTQLCQRVITSWNESTVTYNTKPLITSTHQASHTTSGNYDTWETWDITDIAQDWIDGESNYGVWFIQDGLTVERGKSYHDEDMTNKPKLVIDYTPPTDCGEPTTVSVSPTIAETSATLSWSGASAGTNNSITGYDIQYCVSSDGVNWGSWTTLTSVSTTATSYELTVYPQSTRGYYRKYRVRTKGSAGSDYYSDYAESSNTLKKNEIPNQISGTPTVDSTNVVMGEDVRVSFVNAGDDDSNLAGYEVAMQDSDSEWYGAPTIVGTNASGSATYVDVNTTGFTAGSQWKFLVRGYDSFGIRGSWSTATELVTIGDVPSAVRNIAFTGGINNKFESPVNITWQAPEYTYGLSYTYEVQLGVWNGSSYDYGSAISTGTTASYDWDISGQSRGDRLIIQVRATNVIGDGDWADNSTAMYYNQIPATPTIIFPKSSTTIYNDTPRIGFTYGLDADGHSVLGTVTLDSTAKDASTDYWSNKNAKTTAACSLVQGWELSDDTYIVYAKENDGLVNSSTTQRTFTVVTPTWTDSTLTSGVTAIKAVHVTELREIIEDIYNYYGLSAPVWTDSTLSVIKAVHIKELRTAIDAVRTHVNSFDAGTAKDIPAFNWTDYTLSNVRIKAQHIIELREAITLL